MGSFFSIFVDFFRLEKKTLKALEERTSLDVVISAGFAPVAFPSGSLAPNCIRDPGRMDKRRIEEVGSRRGMQV
jgi:hypothetical protein